MYYVNTSMKYCFEGPTRGEKPLTSTSTHSIEMERPTPFTKINHIKLAAKDIRRTQSFYAEILGCIYIPEYDHKTAEDELFASMVKLQHEGKDFIIEIRHNEQQAKVQEGWDPITWGVPAHKDLDIWEAWFGEHGVKSSQVFTAIKGWVLCALDPDGKIVRIYCDEEHEWTTNFDHDEFWLA